MIRLQPDSLAFGAVMGAGGGYQMDLPCLDSPPPAPWGGHIQPPPEREPVPEEDRPIIEEPWLGPTEPVREPVETPSRWRCH